MNYCNNKPPTNATYTNDGHGGNAQQHREEMRQIAIDVVKEYTPIIAADIYNQTITRLIGAIKYDVETVVSVAVDNAEEIFNSSKFKRVVSDRILQELKAKITDINIKL